MDEIREIFNNAAAGVLVDYRGLEANKIVELRQQLRNSASTMKVLKNTLARIASEGTPFGVLEKGVCRDLRLGVLAIRPCGSGKDSHGIRQDQPSVGNQGGCAIQRQSCFSAECRRG